MSGSSDQTKLDALERRLVADRTKWFDEATKCEMLQRERDAVVAECARKEAKLRAVLAKEGNMSIDKVREGFGLIKDGIKVLQSGPLDHYLDKLVGCYDLLINRFSPFKVGDVAILRTTPEISEDANWGLLGGKHFLIAGAKGIVREVDVEGDGFYFFVAFDNDSWIESFTKKVHPRPPKDRGLYRFHEDELAVPVPGEDLP